MPGAAFTTRLRVANPDGCTPLYSVKNAEIVNVGELCGLDSNGNIVVAGKNGVIPVGVFVADSHGTASTFTGDSTGSVKGFLARRAVVSGFTGLTIGGRVFLANTSTGGNNNYTQTTPNTNGDKVLTVGIAISSTEVQVNLDQTPLAYQTAASSVATIG